MTERMLLVAALALASPQFVLACDPVADLIVKSRADLPAVKIKRSTSASVSPAVLCAEDEVNVAGARGVRVTVRFRGKPGGEVSLSGDTPGASSLIVPKLPSNSVAQNSLSTLRQWAFAEDPGIKRVQLVTKAPRVVTSPLSRGEDQGAPYFLLSGAMDMHFFWVGGQAPWQVSVRDASGASQASAQVEAPEAHFPLVLRDGDELTLIVRSADNREMRRTLKVVPPPEEIRDLPAGSWSRLWPLIGDADRNWRLYVWNTVRQLPESPTQRSVLQHLRDDDL